MRKFSVVAIIVLMFALSASAFAASKPGGYLGSAGGVQDEVGTAGQVLGDTTTAGQLPFTGTELGVFTAAGLLLIGAGFSMRRAARRRN